MHLSLKETSSNLYFSDSVFKPIAPSMSISMKGLLLVAASIEKTENKNCTSSSQNRRNILFLMYCICYCLIVGCAMHATIRLYLFCFSRRMDERITSFVMLTFTIPDNSPNHSQMMISETSITLDTLKSNLNVKHAEKKKIDHICDKEWKKVISHFHIKKFNV